MTFRSILPAGLCVAEGWVDGLQGGLAPAEARLLGAAAAQRRREFTAGRSCARSALAGLGVPPAPLLAGARRQPLWPPDVVGSITHTRAYCAAAVGRASGFAAVGIDAELHTPLPHGVAGLACSDAERRWCERDAGRLVHRATLLFSAKESVFKAVFPLTGRAPGFVDLAIAVDLEAGSFRPAAATPRAAALAPLLAAVHGAFALYAGHVLTAAWIAAPDAPLRSAGDRPPACGGDPSRCRDDGAPGSIASG
jgi:4'-phosphopantetheinyl transferase EntD